VVCVCVCVAQYAAHCRKYLENNSTFLVALANIGLHSRYFHAWWEFELRSAVFSILFDFCILL